MGTTTKQNEDRSEVDPPNSYLSVHAATKSFWPKTLFMIVFRVLVRKNVCRQNVSHFR